MSEYKRLTSRYDGEARVLGIGHKKAFEKLAEYEDIGSPEDFAELAKAKAEERLAILPCKPGDKVYTIDEIGYPCELCDCPEDKKGQCYRQKTGHPVKILHECPTVYKINHQFCEGFTIGGKGGKVALSPPGEWGYEGLETFGGVDGKCYFSWEEAEAALREGWG